MNWPAFKTRASGKWVLTGEHSVLRGATAIALPHPEFGLSLDFEPDERMGTLRVEPQTAQNVIQELLSAFHNQFPSTPRGTLRVESSIPIGAGLGSSAALCVAMSRWWAKNLKITDSEILRFATRLEDRFHGKSSGMDIAVITAGQPIVFSMENGMCPLQVKKIPRFTFHDTGIRASTRECIQQVEAYGRRSSLEGLQRDQAMNFASRLAMEGLLRYDEGEMKQGISWIRDAMQRAQDCFYLWKLIPAEAEKLESELLKQGALAVKMTGAGGGGMLVALWEDSFSTH